MENCFDSLQSITKKMSTHYSESFKTEILKLVFSVDIIGNPMGLLNNIGTGVTDLVEKPIEGFVQGPLEGGVGIVKGAGSLVKNIVAGTMNSFNKVTGSVATGISFLSLVLKFKKN